MPTIFATIAGVFTCVAVTEHGARIEITATDAVVVEQAVVRRIEHAPSLTVRVNRQARIAVAETHGAGGCVADGDSIREDLLHPIIRREFGALVEADGCRKVTQLGIDEINRLFLEDVVELLELGGSGREYRKPSA